MNRSIRFPHLGISFGYVGETVSVFGYEITIYGLVLAAAMLLGLAVVILRSRRQNQDQNLYLEALIPGIVLGLISARFFYVAMHWKLFQGQTVRAFVDLRTGGMSFTGGLLGGIIATALFCKIRKLSFSRMADILSIGVLVSQMIAVWGNFFSREFIGEYTDSIFAMQIPLDAVRSSELTAAMQEHLVKTGDGSWVQVHPLFLYESLWCLVLLLILLVYTRRKMFQGEIFMRYLAGYGLGNAAIEWIRADKVCIPGTQMSVLVPVYLAVFVVLWIVAEVRRFLSRKRDRIHRRRKEQRYQSEEKVSRSYGDMKSFEDVSDEFRDILSGTSQQQSETEEDILQKSNELPKTISDSEQTEDETK